MKEYNLGKLEENYLMKKCYQCLFCSDPDNMEWKEVVVIGRMGKQEVRCGACGATWATHFMMNSITVLKYPKQPR